MFELLYPIISSFILIAPICYWYNKAFKVFLLYAFGYRSYFKNFFRYRPSEGGDGEWKEVQVNDPFADRYTITLDDDKDAKPFQPYEVQVLVFRFFLIICSHQL